MKKIIQIYFFLISLTSVFGQDEYVVNQTKYTQKINASYFGMNELNRVGVLYNSLKVNNATTMDNKYLFGSLAFPDLNFTIGLDLNSFKMPNTNLTLNLAKLAYIYTIQLGNETFLLPGLYVGFGSSNLNVDNLVFEDQLDTATGFINTESIDPLADIIANTSYFDMGASFILHSEDYLVGLSLKHLNRPNTSFNKEVPYEKPIQVSVQGGYEFNINPYEFRYLPRYSYLYSYGSVTKFGAAYFYHHFTPNVAEAAAAGEAFIINPQSRYSHDVSTYIADDFKISNKLFIFAVRFFMLRLFICISRL